MGISVNTLGSYLNSDFDENEPYNREDNKQYTIEALKAIQATGMEVMTEGGNAYAWQFVDHITDIALDSSRFKSAYATVPFLGMVLHGYVQIAGTPVNMEGNLEYAMLKSMESGAALQFVIAYDNTEFLKNDPKLSENFSVQYQIWRDDIVAMYKELNAVLKNVQTSTIVDHKFINQGAYRVLDLDELERDAQLELEALLKEEASRESAEKEAQREAVYSARLAILNGVPAVLSALNDATIQKRIDAIQAKIDAQMIDDATVEDQLIDVLNSTGDENEKKTAIVAFVKELSPEIIDTMDLANEVIKAGDLAMSEETKKAIMESNFKDAVKNDLMDMLTDEFKNALNTIKAQYAPEKIPAATIDTLYAMINAALEANGSALRTEDIEDAKFNYTVKDEGSSDTENNGSGAAVSGNDKRYEADVNKVVYEKYENGAEFLLNFNNYSVMVTIAGRTYTIDAYGYVVLNYGANS